MVVKLLVASEEEAGTQAQALISQARVQLPNEIICQQLINLIETIVVYKLPQKSREDIATMLGLSELKQTRFYQEVHEEGRLEGKIEGKIEAVPRLVQLNFATEAIAQILDLPLEVVTQAIEKIPQDARDVADRNLRAFVRLLATQPSLFTAEYLTALAAQIELLSDESEALWQIISIGLEPHTILLEAHRQAIALMSLPLGGNRPDNEEIGEQQPPIDRLRVLHNISIAIAVLGNEEDKA